MKEMEQKNVKLVDIADFRQFIEKIKNNSSNGNVEIKKIHEVAFKLWKAVLLCKNYEIPRDIAKKSLRLINRMTWRPNEFSIDIETNTKMNEQFKDWIQNWQYNTGSDLKVKVLFMSLFKTDKNNNILVFKSPTQRSFLEPNKIQLDHMEAQNPSDSNKEKHFYPSDAHEPREKYINSLGNIMILDSDDNNNKNNKPLEEAMVYYENMASGHWLNCEVQELLNKHNKPVSIAGKTFKIPNEKFFNERSSVLISYFEKLLQRKLDDTQVTLS